jgi:hypothetical protein
MASPQQEQQLPSSPELSVPSSASINISPSNYLTVPVTRPSRRLPALPGPSPFEHNFSDAFVSFGHRSTSEPLPHILEPTRVTTPTACLNSSIASRPNSLSERLYMSVYSTSSVDTDLSEFSNPPARSYRVSNSQKMSRKITVVRIYLVDMQIKKIQC